MRTLIQPTIIILLYVCARCADLAITAGAGKAYIRSAIYGIIAVLALIALIVALVL